MHCKHDAIIQNKTPVLSPSLFQLCSQVLECPTTINQGSRFLGGIPRTSENLPAVWMTLHHVSLSFQLLWLSLYPPHTPLPSRPPPPSAYWAFKLMESCAVKVDIITIIPTRSSIKAAVAFAIVIMVCLTQYHIEMGVQRSLPSNYIKLIHRS